MSSQLSKQIRDLFKKAALQNEAAQGLSADDWTTYRAIQAAYDRQIQIEQKAFKLDYQTRVEIEHKRLINKSGAIDYALKPPWPPPDKFDKAATLRQARRSVQFQHDQLIASLKDQEGAELTALLSRASKRQSAGELPKRDFSHAANRRSGKDRRKGPSR